MKCRIIRCDFHVEIDARITIQRKFLPWRPSSLGSTARSRMTSKSSGRRSMAPAMKIAAGITIGFVAIVGFAAALSHGIFASKGRQEAAETALVQDHAETALINHEIGRQAEAHDNEVAATKAAAYEKIPEIQVLRALEAEDRRELAKRSPSPIPPHAATR
jgi:hypothetical protein